MNKVRTVVIGASGYIGGEAVRLLLGHPHVDLVAVTANENAGKRLDEVQPNLRGFSDLTYTKDWPEADLYVLSLPHGGAMDGVPRPFLCVPLKLRGKLVGLFRAFPEDGARASARTGEMIAASLSAAVRSVLLYRSLLATIEEVAWTRRKER